VCFELSIGVRLWVIQIDEQAVGTCIQMVCCKA
jgi:hypothetical protein